MFKTGSVSILKVLVKLRCSTRGTVTTKASAAFAISLDFVLPERGKDKSIFGRKAWGAKHVEILELIKLLGDSSFPERSVGELLKIADGEFSDSLFLVSAWED